MMKERIIFHIDVNSAFLSWEATKRLDEGCKIDIRDIPSVIGGNEATRHGVVLAKSIPAKKYGIVTGESLHSARQKWLVIFKNLIKYILYGIMKLKIRCENYLLKNYI